MRLGLDQTFGLPDRKAHNLGVCVPAHAKPKQVRKKITKTAKRKSKIKITDETVIFEAEKEAEDTLGRFEVTGLFAFKGTTMLQGKVLEGKIAQKLTAELNEKEFTVQEVQCDGKKVEELQEGQRGALFLKEPIHLKTGTVIEFQG